MRFFELVEHLRVEGSSKGKAELIRKAVKDDGMNFILLDHAYDIRKQFYIKQIDYPDFKNYREEFESFDEAVRFFLDLCKDLSNRKFGRNDSINHIKAFLARCEDRWRDSFICILKKDLKAGVNVSSINNALNGQYSIYEHKLQLANKYEVHKKYDIPYWYVSFKLNGIRCNFCNNEIVSKNGLPITGFEYVREELERISRMYNLTFIDGEFYKHGTPLREIAGWVNSDEVDKKEHGLKVHVFCIDGTGINNTDDMVNVLNDMKTKEFEHVVIHDQIKMDDDKTELNKLCKQAMKDGYEGLMLKSPFIHITGKRSDDLLKYKLFLDADMKVVDMVESDKRPGHIKGLICVGYTDAGQKIVANVGTGFTVEQRKEIFDNRDEYIGKVCIVNFQDVSKYDEEYDAHRVSFPIIVSFREDKDVDI